VTLLLCALTVTAGAQTQYVVEQVVVAVTSSPDGAGERIAQIKSGDAVEVLERQGEEAQVRLAGGQEGWVRASYLSAEPPLRGQLAERSTQLAALTQEVTRLKAELAAAQAASRAMSPVPAAAPAAPAAPAPDDLAEPESAPAHDALPWQIGALLAALAAGFFLGWRVLDRRIRRKYGGLRIY
jgi:hypothetical protein